MEQHVCITSVVKNRGWVLPYFLDCLAKLDYPDAALSCVLIDDASTDETPALLKAFRARYKDRFQTLKILTRKDAIDNATSARDTSDRPKGYPHLSALRNEALEEARSTGAAYQFSIDSDILVSPGSLRGLLGRNLPYVASIIFNDLTSVGGYIGVPITGRVSNCGYVAAGNAWRPFRRYQFGQLYPCGYSGAVYLVDRTVLDCPARFAAHPVGEDIGYCLQLQEVGIDRYLDATLRCVHVMLPQFLQEALGVYYAWFGTLPEAVR